MSWANLVMGLTMGKGHSIRAIDSTPNNSCRVGLLLSRGIRIIRRRSCIMPLVVDGNMLAEDNQARRFAYVGELYTYANYTGPTGLPPRGLEYWTPVFISVFILHISVAGRLSLNGEHYHQQR